MKTHLKQKQTTNKYFKSYRNALSAFLQYRINLALYSVGHVISLTSLYFLWQAIYASGHALGTYTFTTIISYYVLIALIRLTINEGTSMAFQVTTEIREGAITSFLVKPFSYPIKQFVEVLAKTTLNLAIVIPVLILGDILFNFGNYLPNGISLAYGAAWALLALFLYVGIYFLVAITSFWVERANSYIYATIVLSNFFNGSLVPLDAFPPWFLSVSQWLPFKYLMFVPIQAFLGRYTFTFIDIGIGLGWLIILGTLINVMWTKGLRQYEGQGI